MDRRESEGKGERTIIKSFIVPSALGGAGGCSTWYGAV